MPVAGREESGWDAPPFEGDIAQGDGDRFFRAPIRPPREEAFRRDTQGGCMQALPIRPRTDTKPPGIRVIPL